MQTISLSSNPRSGQLLDSKTSLRQRAVRFLSDRYAQRERPSVAAELILLAVIVLTAAWPLITLVRLMARIR